MKVYTFLKNSFIKVTKYFAPPMDKFLIGPQTPKCTISKGFVASFSTSLPNFVGYCLPFMYASQTNIEVEQEFLHRFMLLIMLWNAKTFLTFKNFNQQYQSSIGLPPPRKHMKLFASAPHISVKVIWYKFPSCQVIATVLPFIPPTIHSFT